MRRPLGDHAGAYGRLAPGHAISRGAARPSCPAMYRRYSPLRSLKYATERPSGLQSGRMSAAPPDAVRLRTSPFSAGTVNTSPRASTTARLPVLDSDMLDTRAVTSFHPAIIQGK